jgi:hypothetical protein
VGAEPSVEVLQRPLEPNFGGVEIPHRRGEPIFSEIVRLDAAGLRDQLHRSHRRLIVPVGEHVYVRVGDPFGVALARYLRQPTIGQTAFAH